MSLSEEDREFPYALPEDLAEEVEPLKKRYSGYLSGAITVGPNNYFMQGIYQDYAKKIYNFKFRPTDVVVASFPKTGTTWTQELVWLLVNNCDFSGAKVPLDQRFPFMEADCIIDRRVFEFGDVAALLQGEPAPGPWHNLLAAQNLPQPRTIKTHMPFSLLSPHLLNTSKVIYVTRDPRDALVSYFHHHKIIKSHGFTGTLEEFAEDFLDDRVLYAPFWSHVDEAWERRSNPNLLIVTYEDLKADLPRMIRSIATFLDVMVSEAQMKSLVAHLHVDAMKENPAVNPKNDPIVQPQSGEEGFIRKGQVGGWRSRLSMEVQSKLRNWMEEKGRGLDEQLGWRW